MTRKEKIEIVEGLAEQFAATDYFYVVDAEGLSTGEIHDFRKRCTQAGVTYQVVKNTLIKKALEKLKDEVDYTEFSSTVLKGFSGVLFAKNVGNAPARVIKTFRKQNNLTAPLLKGASVDQVLFIGENHLDVLSKLKSKTELIADVITLLQTPITRLMASMQSGKQQIAGIIAALAEKKA